MDKFTGHGQESITSGSDSVAVTPDDIKDLPAIPEALYIGTGGHLKMAGATSHPSSAGTIWKNVPSGSLLPFRARRIFATGTTATDIVAIYYDSVPSGASITSPSSVTQPSASQRFFLPTADRAGTWGKGGSGDAAQVTIDPVTGIWSINQESTGDGTAQIVKTFPLIFTPADGSGSVEQTIVDTLAIVAAPGSISESYVADFNGTAGTKISALPGWSISQASVTPVSEPILDGAGRLKGTEGYYDQDGLWAALYTPSSVALGGSEVTFVVSAPASDNYQRTRIFVGASDYANGIGVGPNCKAPNADPGIFEIDIGQIFSKQGNVVSDVTLPFFGYLSYKRDNTADFKFKFSSDGNTMTIAVVGATTVSGTVDLTGRAKGNKFGVAGLAPYVPAMEDECYLKAISYIKPVIALSVGDSPLYSDSNIATYTLAWSGIKPTRLQHRFYDDLGVPVTPWMTGESTVVGTGSGTIAYVATAPIGGALTAHFRPLNDIPVIVEAPEPTYFLANVISIQVGYNVRGANYYQPVPIDNNWGHFCEVQDGNFFMPHDAIDGISDIQTTPGTIWNSSDADVTIVSQNNTTGTLQLSIVDTSGSTGRYIGWTGVRPTTFNVTRQGRTGRTPTEWINGVEGVWLRDLDACAANIVPENSNLVRNTLDTMFYANDIGTGPDIPYQSMTDAVAAKMAADPNFIGWWSVLGVDLTDAEHSARATYQRDNLPPSAKLALEFGNEVWNEQFTAHNRVKLDGVKYGYYGNATYSSPQPQLNITYEGGGRPGTDVAVGDDPGSGKTIHAVAAGDYILFNVYGIGNAVYRAKQNAPAGTFVCDGTLGNPIENAYFQRDMDKDPSVAGRRWRTVRHKQILEIYRTVFGEARFQTQIVPVVMGQAGGGWYDQFAVERTYVPDYWDTMIKGAGYAFYFGPSDTLDPSTVTAASLEISCRDEMPRIKASIRQAVVDALRTGKIPMFYEGMSHPDYDQYTASTNYREQWNLLMSSELGRQLMSDIAYFMKITVPGIIIGYDLVGSELWSLKRNWRDTANKRRLGWLEGLARP